MAFSYTHGMPIPGWTPIGTYKRGVPVLRWASDDITNDREIVQFLVWSNPANLGSASFALKADPDIVSTALKSQFHSNPEPVEPSYLVLFYADEKIRNDRSSILAHLASTAHEVEFLSPDLRADKTLTIRKSSGLFRASCCPSQVAQVKSYLHLVLICMAHGSRNQVSSNLAMQTR